MVGAPLWLSHSAQRRGEANKILRTISSLLTAFKTLTPVPLLSSISPFFCFPNPLPLTHLLFLEASWPASLKELMCYSNCGLEKVLQQDRQASRTEEFLVLQDQILLQEARSS